MKTRSISPFSHFLLGGSAIALLIAGGCTAANNSGAEPVATEKRADATPADAAPADATPADAAPAGESASDKTASDTAIGKEATGKGTKSKDIGNWQKVVGLSVDWRPSFEEAMAEAKRTNKPVIVDFYATWCPPCKLMDKETWSDPTVIKESANWVMIKVDSEKRPDVFSQYSTGSLPTVVFLRPDAKPANGFIGFKDAKEVAELMRSTYTRAVGDTQAA